MTLQARLLAIDRYLGWVSAYSVMEFKELTSEEWNCFAPHLPPPARTGRPRANDRATTNGIRYVLITGCRWMDMPTKYGSYKTAWRRLKQWAEKEVWKKVLNRLIGRGYSTGRLSLKEVSIDSTTVEAKKGGSSSVLMDIREGREARFMLR